SGQAMIPAVLQSSLLLLMALIGARLFRRRQAAIRHFVLTIGVASALAVPVAAHFIPKFTVRSLPALDSFVSDQTGVPSPSSHTDVTANAATTRVHATAPQRLPGESVWWIWIGGVATAAAVSSAGINKTALLVSRSKRVTNEGWTDASVEVAR